MKSFTTSFALTFLASALSLACQPEAQIMGTVTQVQKDTQSEVCFVDASFSGEIGYKASGVCPLDEALVHQQGILVKMLKNEKCQFSVGDEISGYLVQSQDGTISLEQ